MKNKRTKFKKTVLGVAAIATALLVGTATACANESGDETPETEPVAKIDSQEIKNGNFEFYNDNEGLYPISTPDNWTGGTKGNSSASMSGIINTRKDRWDYITDSTLPEKLEKNDDLDSEDEDKKDYNGALTDDMPYKNTHAATTSGASESDLEYIANPFTHKYSYDADGKVINTAGEEVKTYTDEDGNYFTDEALTSEFDTSVLMLHNYRRSYNTGTESYFKSGTTVTLEASTACEISLWVKTCDLYFDGADGRREVKSERGAYIQVDTQVGGNSLDSVVIKNINTEILNPSTEDKPAENNGWVQYTVYVEASSFADTTVTLTLGLGEDSVYTVEGYAFFDDVKFTKYLNKAELEAAVNENEDATYFDDIVANSTSHPLDPDGTYEFRTDKETHKTNSADGTLTEYPEEHNFGDRHFFIDFASSLESNAITFDSVSAGFTVEDTTTGKYVCSNGDVGKKSGVTFTANDPKCIIPNKLKAGIDVSSDILATLPVTDAEDWKCVLSTEYDDLLTDALKTAPLLPGVEGGATNALVMLSARGAAYEAEITDDKFTLADGEYKLISFWIKTSDMDGKTAATITAASVDDKDNTSNFTVDSTTVNPVTIGEHEDVYNGWVKCFVRVSNTSKEVGAKSFKLKVNFGTTTIKGTSVSSYNKGWLAIANASIMDLDEDVYGYTSSAAQSATLGFTEKKTDTTYNFDSEQGEKNKIETDVAIPENYTGVFGASINVNPTGEPAGEYDKTNSYPYAGLINKENVANYAEENHPWYGVLSALANENDPTAMWSKVVGDKTVQPLLIVNSVLKDNTRFNYGYIGKSASVSANGYSAVSVRVKVSEGAMATVYLVEDGTSSSEVLSYKIPNRNFWYDDDGNVLKGELKSNATLAEKKENIAYSLRKDGLYENGDGKLYANIYNLTKYYDVKFEHSDFFNANGEAVNFEDLVQGETYYANAQKTAYAPHYLVAGGEGNSKVYEYKEGVDGNEVYYYVEKGVTNKNKEVVGFDTTVATLRYSAEDASPYKFTIDCRTDNTYADKWVTVTFNVHAGSAEKKYRLELWSGTRDEKTSYADVTKDSYVLFDYSNVSLDEESYNERLDFYTEEILADYKELLFDKEFDNNDVSLADLEKLGKEDDIYSSLYNYYATHYTYSLYDSEAFIPFNGETAEKDQVGYSYSYSDYEESLAYLTVEDNTDESAPAFSAFIDYSVLDKDIDIIGVPTPPESDDDADSETTATDANVWLLAASIALVAAILVAIVAIFIRDYLKKHHHKKSSGKNSYNFNKNKRYVKKYVKANGEAPEIKEGDVDESLLSDQPEEAEAQETAENAEATESVEGAETAESEQTEAEESAEDGAPADENAEETPAEEAPTTESTEEAPAEESPASNEGADGDNKE